MTDVEMVEISSPPYGAEDHGFVRYIADQARWARGTFGPDRPVAGVVDHMVKEMVEIQEDPTDPYEYIDMIILSLDALSRLHYKPGDIADMLYGKFARNVARKWPDWRTADPDKAIEHVRD